MNIDLLNNRLNEINNAIGMQQAILKQQDDALKQGYANLNALIGSRSEVEHWIAELNKPKEAEKPQEDEVKEAA